MEKNLVFLDTVLVQQDMRIRLPKSVLMNINCAPGKTRLSVFFDASTKEIVLRTADSGDNANK